MIVNETFARPHFPGEDPIGRTLITGMGQLPSQIVGVVADVRSTGLNTPPEADYFLPALQRPETFTNILVRTNLGPTAMASIVRTPCGRWTRISRCSNRNALHAHRADHRRPQAGTRAARGIRRLALVLASLGVYA